METIGLPISILKDIGLHISDRYVLQFELIYNTYHCANWLDVHIGKTVGNALNRRCVIYLPIAKIHVISRHVILSFD